MEAQRSQKYSVYSEDDRKWPTKLGEHFPITFTELGLDPLRYPEAKFLMDRPLAFDPSENLEQILDLASYISPIRNLHVTTLYIAVHPDYRELSESEILQFDTWLDAVKNRPDIGLITVP